MQSLVGSVGVIPARGWNTCEWTSPARDDWLSDGGPVGHPLRAGASVVQLPGARGPGEPGYDPLVDGTTTGLVIPAAFGASAGQQFRSEMAALSFNFQLLATALSSPPDANNDLQPGRSVGARRVRSDRSVQHRGRASAPGRSRSSAR